MHISCSYAKSIGGNKFFHTGDSPNWVKSKRRRETERLNDGNNNGELRIANVTSGGARKAAWAKTMVVNASHLVELFPQIMPHHTAHHGGKKRLITEA